MQPIDRITPDDLPAFARGCGVLGTGGGGSVDSGLLAAGHALSRYGDVLVVPLAKVPDDGLVLPLSGIGAPTVSHEMPMSGEEPVLIAAEVERIFGRPVSAVMASEIGGSNGVGAVAWAARLGVPLVDADSVGRAFPEVQMVSQNIAGLPVNLIVLADVQGNLSTIRPVDGPWSEAIARAVAVACGGSALMADYVMTGRQLHGAVVEGSVSSAVWIGRTVADSGEPVRALAELLRATTLITGKVVDVERRTGGGFVRGSLIVDGTGGDRGRMLRVEIQNENLVAFEDGRVRACVPDLITVVDAETADAVSTESLRYGQRITVLSWPCHPLWRTPRGLEIAGPRAFGYDLDYTPVEDLR
ncbi:DUF917 domain-containing protein [Streptomyces sp. NBC_00873]|uniref:DUF917 domain-containing protein n=1 Tax=unclassified Streptomyces TaxID=2593676 RepID=UPI00386ECDD5|nr:DUF917 domain-containing protein [Streptomyces sp. NBC_00873]WTA42131.1 DUF917 domain-containing protein [Streptomyces sp. NBC_00842]